MTTDPPPGYDFVTSNSPNDVTRIGSNPIQHEPQTRRKQPVVFITPSITTQNVVYVNTHLGWSIFNILFCCPIFSCIACFFSIRTDDAKSAGDLQNALKNSKAARIINTISTVLGVVICIAIFIPLIIYFSTAKRVTDTVVAQVVTPSG